MHHHRFQLQRRELLTRCLGVAGAYALATAFNPHDAAAKTSKEALLYQDQPNAGKRCENCKFFSPGSDANAGSCALVDGVISRNGWCTAFSAKA